MSMPTVREFISRHQAAAAGLAGLAAMLEAKATGVPLDASIAARIEDLLVALGGPAGVDDIAPQEAAATLHEIRHNLLLDATLLDAKTRSNRWSYTDPAVLEEIGEFSRNHALSLSRNVIPALAGLAAQFAGKDAAFLDIGVGIGGISMEMALLWPSVRVVGIDVWQPSLALARENVARANLSKRIELREQGAEALEDEAAFDLAWMPMIFMPEQIVPAAVTRTRHALKPGGWVVLAFGNLEHPEPIGRALIGLRTAMFGGPTWLPGRVESMLRDDGYVDVCTLPSPPGVPVAFVVGRRAPA